MTEVYLEPEIETAARKTFKRMLLIGGIISFVLGLVLIIWPERTLVVVTTLIGVWLIIVGILRIVEALITKGVSGGMRALGGIIGLLYVIVGTICLRNLLQAVEVLAVLIGLIWIIGGVTEIATGFSRMGGWAKIGTVLLGLLSVAAGLVLFLWPAPSLLVLVWVTGLWLAALGILQVILAFTTKSVPPLPPVVAAVVVAPVVEEEVVEPVRPAKDAVTPEESKAARERGEAAPD
jgi:uncharacterized membrane protein HdeD (DUF308 family)